MKNIKKKYDISKEFDKGASEGGDLYLLLHGFGFIFELVYVLIPIAIIFL